MHPFAVDSFDTAGSYFYAGRWHTAGSRVIYAAQYASLAALETLIHSGRRKIPQRAITRIHIPDAIAIEQAPWMDLPDSQIFGARWLRELRTAVLRVPSVAVNRMESNFVLNPSHPEFTQIQRDRPATFVFDPRLFDASAEIS
ncbi:MAG: RES domain-containing protein [Terracidiphilus sp.]|jgi:RES domain-containing protein